MYVCMLLHSSRLTLGNAVTKAHGTSKTEHNTRLFILTADKVTRNRCNYSGWGKQLTLSGKEQRQEIKARQNKK